MISKFTDHREWRAEAIRRGLTLRNETGYTEDLCADICHFAYGDKDDAVGHCIGGPCSELSAVLFDSAAEYDRYIYSGEYEVVS